MRLSRTLKAKWPLYEQRYDKVILQHDNAQLYVAQSVKTYLETLKWEDLSHSNLPDIAPSDYYLFRLMAYGLAEQHFHSYEDAKKWILDNFKRHIVFSTWNSNPARKIFFIIS